ncbi:hypothetical protein B0T24DRAFT_591453 [Lasiosphaeria ovina]|uniref:Uncharacterized protein n=1 Tax=Lasiosphaeria ovina TaxID=92902 RepID=A0AAE0NAS9_9PEZI|nr:hypothetical protein B0T24DRAFT_591453 [Lasiosphaeria ovina]
MKGLVLLPCKCCLVSACSVVARDASFRSAMPMPCRLQPYRHRRGVAPHHLPGGRSRGLDPGDGYVFKPADSKNILAKPHFMGSALNAWTLARWNLGILSVHLLAGSQLRGMLFSTTPSYRPVLQCEANKAGGILSLDPRTSRNLRRDGRVREKEIHVPSSLTSRKKSFNVIETEPPLEGYDAPSISLHERMLEGEKEKMRTVSDAAIRVHDNKDAGFFELCIGDDWRT